MSTLPVAIHTADQVRALDRHAIDDLQIPSYTLMTRAGEAALGALRSCWPSTQRIAVVCGPGNNGGDGYVLARLARAQRLEVVAIALHEPARLEGDARRAHDDFLAAGGTVGAWHENCLRGVDVIVDAIFGVGLSRPVAGVAAEAILAINDCDAHVLALDIPSGLHADTGEILGVAVRAKRTLTFLGLKLGFYLGEGPNCVGVVMFDGLELPAQALAHVAPTAVLIDEAAVAELLPPRRRTTHKGQQGSVLVIGGNIGMAGAARMAGEAALRAGAGLVTVATRNENVAAVVGARPELLCRGIETAQELTALIAHADVIAIGPGLGQDDWAQAMFDTRARQRSAHGDRCRCSESAGAIAAREDALDPDAASRRSRAPARQDGCRSAARSSRYRSGNRRALRRHRRAQGCGHTGREPARGRRRSATAATLAWLRPGWVTC